MMGQLDTKLNQSGIRQAKLLAKRLSVVNFDYVYSSDLDRAKKTTSEIMKYQNCPVEYAKELRERNLGIFTGKPKEEYYKYIKENLSIDSDVIPGGGESMSQIRKRVTDFIDRIYNKHKNETVLLSTHNGPKKQLMMFFNNIKAEDFMKYHIARFDNVSLSVVQFHESGKHKIILENCIKHLN